MMLLAARQGGGGGAGSRKVSGGQSGFSLVEVLIAMLVLSVGAASILSLFAAAASTHRRAVDRTNAALAAERVFSEVRAEYVEGRQPGEVVESVKAKLPDTLGAYRYDVLLFHPQGDGWSDDELFARVTLRWKFLERERAEAFHAVLLPSHRIGESRGGGLSTR